MKKFYAILTFTAMFFAVNAVYSQTNAVADSSFEGGSPSTAWAEGSTNFGTPLCDAASCGTCGGPCVAHSGAWYVWIGGITGSVEDAYVSQSVTIPSGTSANLTFWYMVPIGSNADLDTTGVILDSAPLWFSTNADSSTYGTYTKITVPINSYANGAPHTLFIGGRTHGTAVTNFIYDDISIIVQSGAGINTTHVLEGINIYPNPTTEKIFIDVNAPVVTDYNIIIYDMQGQKVFEQSYTDFNNNKIEINTSDLAKGSYSLIIDSKFERTIEKIVIQ